MLGCVRVLIQSQSRSIGWQMESLPGATANWVASSARPSPSAHTTSRREAWLFMSPWLLAYAGTMAVFFHLFVAGYEERALHRRFGSSYREYRRMVSRWIPHPPRRG